VKKAAAWAPANPANSKQCLPMRAGELVNVSRWPEPTGYLRVIFCCQRRSIAHMAPQRIEHLDDARRLQLLVEGVVDYALYLISLDGLVRP
jgi:hypothetical protein